jgi:hypothetical protein
MHFIHDGKAEFPSGLKAVEYGDVVSSKKKPDPECKDFFEPETEIWVWMEDYGVIPKPEPRWNRDCTWNY